MTAPTRDILQTHVVPALTAFLGERGLKLSEAKTRVVYVDDGFDFLGFTVRRYRGTVLTRPQKAKVVQHLRTIGDYLRRHRQAGPSQVIGDLAPLIRGWTAYYRHGASKHVFHSADHHVQAKLWRWAKRRHPTKSAAWVRSRYFDQGWNLVDGRAKLARHDDVAIIRHAKVQGKRSPLNPDDLDYWVTRQRRRLNERMRSSKRSALLRRQDYRCAMCGTWFDPDEDVLSWTRTTTHRASAAGRTIRTTYSWYTGGAITRTTRGAGARQQRLELDDERSCAVENGRSNSRLRRGKLGEMLPGQPSYRTVKAYGTRA